MDTTNPNKIDNYLFTAEVVLKDVEFDMDWEYHQLLTFSMEWADVCGCVSKLITARKNSEMTNDQLVRYEELKKRFEAVSEKLKELNLENPFEQD